MKLTMFRDGYISNLRDRIVDNIDFYNRNSELDFTNKTLLKSVKTDIEDTPPLLSTNIVDDVNNAIKIYEYLPIDETQASDARLWTYLTHVMFRDYVASRWPVRKDNPDKNILERWFLVASNARSLRRNAISRLWWAVHLTVAPWENDDYFSALKNSDRYIYTKTLFMTEDLSQQLLERQLGWSKPILIALLDYFKRDPYFAEDRELSRRLVKEVNLELGYRKIMALELNEIITEIEGLAEEIKRLEKS